MVDTRYNRPKRILPALYVHHQPHLKRWVYVMRKHEAWVLRWKFPWE